MPLSRCTADNDNGQRCLLAAIHPGEDHKFSTAVPPGPPSPPYISPERARRNAEQWQRDHPSYEQLQRDLAAALARAEKAEGMASSHRERLEYTERLVDEWRGNAEKALAKADASSDRAIEALGQWEGMQAERDAAQARVGELEIKSDQLQRLCDQAREHRDMLLHQRDAARAEASALREALQLVQDELNDVDETGTEIAFSDGERAIIKAALDGTVPVSQDSMRAAASQEPAP